MNKWEPIIDNKKGIIYFRNRINNQIQFDYPKQYNILMGEYEDIFFEDWIQEKVIDENSHEEKHYIWKNIKNGFVQKINPNSSTFVLEAALNNNIAFFELFIEYGGNINYEDKLKRNCLHYIVMNDNYNLANLLIKLGCNINKRDIYGMSPFLYSVKNFSFKTMKLLVKNKCDINLKDNKGNTALHYSVINQNSKLIVYLLKHGAKLEIKNNHGKYPIDIAKNRNYWKITKILTKYTYLIEDENYYKLKKLVNSEKYENLIRKKYKLLEKEEKENKRGKAEEELYNNKSKNIIVKKSKDIFKITLFKKNNINKNKNNKYNSSKKNIDDKYTNNDKSNINIINYEEPYPKKIILKNKNSKENVKTLKDYRNKTKNLDISNNEYIFLNRKNYVKIFFLFLIKTIYPYIKNSSLKLYNYSIRKLKNIYKNLKLKFQNIYHNTPNIENQIEYLNFSSISSSSDEIKTNFSIKNKGNSSYNSHKFKKKFELINNNFKINFFKCRKTFYFNKRYIYKIPTKYIYSLNDDIIKIKEIKIILIIKKYHNDKQFIKRFKSYFNLNLKKIFIKWLQTRITI